MPGRAETLGELSIGQNTDKRVRELVDAVTE